MHYQIYSGTGNDFVIMDNRDKLVSFEKQSEFAVKICSERFKDIDGVIFVENPTHKDAELKMNYYNRDGSYGAMCANGGRCIARYSVDNGVITEKETTLEVLNEIYKVEILGNDNVRIYFPIIPLNKLKLTIYPRIDWAGRERTYRGSWLNIGSQHLVISLADPINKSFFGVNNLDGIDVEGLGRIFREQREFQPMGVNVNFMDILSPYEIRVRTYEKGVEKETLSCGTGIISSALVANLLYNVNPPVKVLSESKDWLVVDFKLEGSNIVSISLEGSARKIEEGEMDIVIDK